MLFHHIIFIKIQMFIRIILFFRHWYVMTFCSQHFCHLCLNVWKWGISVLLRVRFQIEPMEKYIRVWLFPWLALFMLKVTEALEVTLRLYPLLGGAAVRYSAFTIISLQMTWSTSPNLTPFPTSFSSFVFHIYNSFVNLTSLNPPSLSLMSLLCWRPTFTLSPRLIISSLAVSTRFFPECLLPTL